MINQRELEADLLAAAGADILRDTMRNVSANEHAAAAAPVAAPRSGENREQEKLHRECIMKLNNEFLETKNRAMIRKKELEMSRVKLQRMFEELDAEFVRDLADVESSMSAAHLRLNKAAAAHKAALSVLAN